MRRIGSSLALLSSERLALVDLTRRLPARECAVPESVLASGSLLTDAVFDAHLSQALSQWSLSV